MVRHIVDPKTQEFFDLDEKYQVWTCDCKDPVELRVSLCLTLDDLLLKEGELRDVERKIAERRKELGLLSDDR